MDDLEGYGLPWLAEDDPRLVEVIDGLGRCATRTIICATLDDHDASQVAEGLQRLRAAGVLTLGWHGIYEVSASGLRNARARAGSE